MKMNKIKRVFIVAMSLLLSLSTFLGIGCGSSDNIDSTKTQLYVYSFTGGVGDDYVNDLVARFEETYKDTEFEPGSGKKGVQIITQLDKTAIESLLNSNNAILMSEAFDYASNATSGKFLDVTDIMTTPLNSILGNDVTSETATIESKLYDGSKEYLALGGSTYYGGPNYTFFPVVTYNKQLFIDEGFYLTKNLPSPIEENGDYFINEYNTDKTCGPDGVEGTEDDGLPATWDEFFILCDYMKECGVTPFTFYGAQNGSYFTYLLNNIYLNLSGKKQAEYNYSYDSEGSTIKIVKDDKTVEEVAIGSDNYAEALNRQETRYQTLQIAEKLIKNVDKYFTASSKVSSYSLARVQGDFATGTHTDKEVGMMIEGSYWYNEAIEENIFVDARKAYANYDQKNDFAILPLPRTFSGSFSDVLGKETKPVICDQAGSYMVINKNISKNENLVKLAKMFFAFSYTEESLKQFTLLSRTPKYVKYDLEASELDAGYPQNMWNFYNSADVVVPYSGNTIFLNNSTTYGLHLTKNFWKGNVQTSVWGAIKNNRYTAWSYFMDVVDKTR